MSYNYQKERNKETLIKALLLLVVIIALGTSVFVLYELGLINIKYIGDIILNLSFVAFCFGALIMPAKIDSSIQLFVGFIYMLFACVVFFCLYLNGLTIASYVTGGIFIFILIVYGFYKFSKFRL
ncbi:hypothetical protein UP12_19475 (plasmid) [Bacillus pumilus]|uniref:hypothetical protein n=1 Tax=Bacillus pumilus TaxID=1408 RepID=UPI000776A711|nr:hypothetical protein [Bacillus pumilus]AMM99588.1 hypothetical protein UP12_19475 [Bacillus pumilus]